jgi:succinate semialdehyde reductase
MQQIKQPPSIIIGNNSCKNFKFKKNCLVITSLGTKNRGWLDYLDISNYHLFDEVEPNPSMDTVIKIVNEFSKIEITDVVGIGGGSSLDVAKYVAYKLKKKKILIPTTFGSGSEVTKISVLKVNGKKKSFHDDNLIADVAIVDSFFIQKSPNNIIKNSAIDAVAQCSEAHDSKNANNYTKFLCQHAFELLEEGITDMDKEKIVMGSLISGLGFGNSSTTLGHAISYVFSNEGYSHGHALAFTTTASHFFNNSVFYSRFKKLVEKLDFKPIFLKQDLNIASEIILKDKKHLDRNPIPVDKKDIIELLIKINQGKIFENKKNIL